MRFKILIFACVFFSLCVAPADQGVWLAAVSKAASAQPKVDPQGPPQVEFITAEELKARITKNQPVTIIDVRSTGSSGSDERRIKGAFHVKLRRLKYRLGFSPLKEAPRDRDVVTYCACPSDESSIRAAQLLQEAGFKRVLVLKGGWVQWQKVNGQIENGF